MTIDGDADHPAIRQLGQTEPPKEEDMQWMQELKLQIKIKMLEMEREMTKKMQEMELEITKKKQEMELEITKKKQEMELEITKKKQEMELEITKKKQEMELEITKKKQEMELEITKKMQENVNPRTLLDHQNTESQGELQLIFANTLNNVIFTKDTIRDREGEYVKIKLINTANHETVKKGHLSSMEIEIVVLQYDFGCDGNEKWTNKEFNDKIINTKKDSYEPLLKGKVKIKLTDGVGTIKDLSFCVNSLRPFKKFRLGARAIGMGTGVIIKEASSSEFAVRQYRVKEKHLKKIENGGKFNAMLIAHGILTKSDVKLKHMFEKNPDELRREIFKGCSDQEWDAFVQHIIRIVDDANSNHLRIPDMQPVVAYNTATTGPLLHQGMQNYSNRASSSQQPENLQEPQAMGTSPSHVGAQLEHSNGIHQPLNNGDSFFPSVSTNHLAVSAAAGPPDDVIKNFLCPSYDPMNGLNGHGYFENEQALMTTGMQNYNNRASSSQQPENLQELQAMATSPTHVRAQLEHSNDIHQRTNNGDSIPSNDFCPSSSTHHMAPGLRDLGNENFPIDDLFMFDDEPVRMEYLY